jgi:hypothetical protein
MHDKRVTAVQMEELVLSATLDALDTPALCQARTIRRKLAPERGMNRPHYGNPLSQSCSSQCARGLLNFG